MRSRDARSLRRLVCLFALVASGCSNSTPAPCEGFSSSFVARDSAGNARQSFASGESIRFEMTVTNGSGSTRVLHNADACPQVRFDVENAAGQNIWSSADGVACAQVITGIEYAPGQSRTFSAIWNQLQRDSSVAPTGAYTGLATERTECGATLSKTLPFSIH